MFFNCVYRVCTPFPSTLPNAAEGVYLEKAPEDSVSSQRRWKRWMVSWPVTLSHKLYNAYLMRAHHDLMTLIAQNTDLRSLINYVPQWRRPSYHVISDPRLVAEVLKTRLPLSKRLSYDILPLLKALYPDFNLGPEDYLHTCSQERHLVYKQALLAQIGASGCDEFTDSMRDLMRHMISHISARIQEGNNRFTLKKLAGGMAALVIHRILSGKTLSIPDAQTLHKDLQAAFFSSQKSELQEERLGRLRSVIGGVTLDAVGDITSPQKALLACCLYVEGTQDLSEFFAQMLESLVTYSSLQPRLNQELEVHHEPREELLEQIVRGTFMKMSPAPVRLRQAQENIQFRVVLSGGKEWTYDVPKGDMLVLHSIAHQVEGDPFAPTGTQYTRVYPDSQVFGQGRHKCPGERIVEEAAKQLIDYLTQHYRISFDSGSLHFMQRPDTSRETPIKA